MTSLRLLVFWNRCRMCGHEFRTVSDSANGGFRVLLSTQSHLPALVDCSNDPAFTEVSRLVAEELPPATPLARQLDVFDYAFGKICDLAPDGSNYEMTGTTRCLRCGSDAVSFGPTEPAEYSTEELPRVTHTRWDNLMPDQKRKTISQLIQHL